MMWQLAFPSGGDLKERKKEACIAFYDLVSEITHTITSALFYSFDTNTKSKQNVKGGELGFTFQRENNKEFMYVLKLHRNLYIFSDNY